MLYGKKLAAIVILPFVLCISCLYSRTSARSFAASARIQILSGKAMVTINGQVNENLYSDGLFGNSVKDEKYYDTPAIREGTITKTETRAMVAGEEYRFSILPTEVVIIYVMSLDGNDVEALSEQYGQEKKYTIQGSNKLGFPIVFQNR
jgi:hypothetical protein